MDCSDFLMLQKQLDGELDEAQAEAVAYHLESCARCRAEANRLGELRTFVQERLGLEDDGEEESTAFALAEVSRIMGSHLAVRDDRPWWYQRIWLATAAILVLALAVPLPFLSDAGASPAEVLEEAADRQRMWAYQPNKVLHWEVETVSRGIKTVADGRWRAEFWRKNGASTFAEISRQLGPDEKIERAYWRRPDGSTVSYHGKTGVVEVGPSTDEMERDLPALPEDLREALAAHLALRATTNRLDVQSRRDADLFTGRSAWTSGGEASFRRGLLGRLGEVHQITVVKEGSDLHPMIARAVHEYDIQSSTLRLLRLKSTVTYTDGTVGEHDSRWIAYRESSDAEFEAQAPRDLLEGPLSVVRLTPRDLATRRLQLSIRADSQ
jgi:hypothetical protein